jgi:His/Glu/Gln/Arg/opine family amino acid ABC transporter permease subunit
VPELLAVTSYSSLSGEFLRAGIETLKIALGAWAVSAVAGLALAVARDAAIWPLKVVIALLTAVLRSIPQLILLYLVFFGLPSVGIQIDALLTAILVLGLADAAFNAEYFRGSLLTVPYTQREAGTSLGFSRLGTMRHIVLPQAMLYMIAPLLNSFLSLIKTATLASAIGLPEILYHSQNEIQTTGEVTRVIVVVIVIYAVVCMPLIRLTAYVERRTKERLYT